MLNIENARKLVRHYPITVSKYDSGQIGFVARPLIKGKRFCKSFSTSVYPTLEEASQAAIAYCNNLRAIAHVEHVETEKTELDDLIDQAKRNGIDHIKAFRAGLLIAIRRRSLGGSR